MERSSSGELLGGALERDDREVPPLGVEANRQIEPDSGLTADESLGRRASRFSWPSRAWLDARRPVCPAPAVIDLVGGGAAKPNGRPVAIIPGEIQRQLVLERGEAERDQGQTPRAFGLDGSDAPLNHRQAPVLPHRSETMANAVTATPPPESLRDELSAL